MATGDDTHHPGPPRFTMVGEGFEDEMFIDFSGDTGGKDRDNLAPRIVGDPQKNPDNYAASDFSWSIKSAPADSSATLMYAPPDGAASNPVEQYDSGDHNVVEFVPDVPGEYVLELDAPDGTHEQWIYAFPSVPSGSGGPPRIDIDGHYDSDTDEFVLESNPRLAPDSNEPIEDLEVYWRADDRDALSFTQLGGADSWTVRIPKSDLGGETGRIHAAPFDGDVHGMTDTVVLDPNSETVEYPNRPPEWMQNGVMYEIFPRSFLPPKAGEWPFENSRANFENFTDRLDYLDELDIDVIWFTPVVPSESANWKPQAYLRGTELSSFKYVGGGPHGYDALSYYQIAEDLGSKYSISEYYDDPATRQAARENAMEEYKTFIQAANDRGIKVCFDFVINHCGRHHEFFQDTIAQKGERKWTYRDVDAWADGQSGRRYSKYFDWFDRMKAPIKTDSGYTIEVEPAETGFAGLRVMPNWNYANVATREHIIAAADFLSGEVGVDAFRCDIAYGVPHSVWKEVREVVRSNDSEFMMLDETIPNDPSMAENEFGMHFDTADFMNAAHSVVEGNSGMQSLYGAVNKRPKEGWPEHSLIVNSTENHDEHRALDLALDSGKRDNPEKAQRAVWAAGVMLPGVPFVYYGQERQLSKYGTNRYDYDGSGEDPRTGSGDVSPGNYSRAFMNWEEFGDTVPQNHVDFYKDVIAYYHDDDVLKPGAALEQARTNNPYGDIIAFRRRKDGDARVVLVNASDGKGYIDVDSSVDTVNRVTGQDVAVSGGASGFQRVGFDTVAVLDAPPVYPVEITDRVGDDHGPGSYNYPTSPDYADGALDVTAFRARDMGTSLRFEVDVDTQIANPWNLAEGFSVQHLQVYLRDPDVTGGTTAGRTGTNVTFTHPYHYRVVVDGEHGARLEDASGSEIATGSVSVSGQTLTVDVPAEQVPSLSTLDLAPLMFGYDPDADGGVVPVEANAGWNILGNGDGSGNEPAVVDLVTSAGIVQGNALAYSSTQKATVPYLGADEPGTELARWSDSVGDDTSTYTYPTNPDFQDGAWDVTDFAVHESHSRYRFETTFDVPYLRNPFDLPLGFSHQFLQIYLRDPAASGGTTTAWSGLGASMEQPYHYRLVVNGQYDRRLEKPDGSGGFTTVTEDVNAYPDGDTLVVDIPKGALNGGLSAMKIAPVVAPFDGTKGDNLRDIASSAGGYTLGGGSSSDDTRVLDVVGSSAKRAVATGSIPYVSMPDAERVIASFDDATGDDAGPGTYTYPTASEFKDGVFDLTNVTFRAVGDRYRVDVTLDGPLDNPWGGANGFSLPLIGLYLRDIDGASPSSTTGRAGTNVTFDSAYHYRIHAEGFAGNSVIEAADGTSLTSDLNVWAEPSTSTITIDFPQSAIGGDLDRMDAAVFVFGQAGDQTGRIRHVAASKGSYTPGGGRDDNMDPNALDMLDPSGIDQSSALDYSSSSKASVPLFSVAGPPTLGSAPAADPDGDGRYEDVDGDGTTDVDDAIELFEQRDSDAVADNTALFDFDGDGDVDLGDVIDLYREVSNR